MHFLRILLLIIYYWEGSLGFPSSLSDNCPTDCICYTDYLHNQESWKWIESDVFMEEDDPEHERFNPYTEHNDVYENPKLHRRRQRESSLSTVTCMIRNNDSSASDKLFNFIPRHTQVLSLIQAPGSGLVKLNRGTMKKFPSLVGLEIKGYSGEGDAMEISGDCFMDLNQLTYLSLETVLLEQTSVENVIQDGPSSKLLRINYTFNDAMTNEITSQILIIKDEKENGESLDGLLPYSEYKKSVQVEKMAPLEPKFRVGFTGLPKLHHLKISGCNLHDISWDIFYKLDNLKFLLLDENDLLFLPDFVFYATSNLTSLSLSRNRILNLQTVGLAGLLYLQKLDVSDNSITHLSELSLPPFPHLEVADFRNNPITSIFPNTFEIMNSTKTLYLGSPTTSLDLSPNSFYGLVSLQKLSITNVKIRLLDKSMLKGMPNLKILKMTGDIPRISYDAFGEVTRLEKLIMKNCSIKKISMDALFGLTYLKELDFSNNSLTFLPPGIFEDQESLVEVFLQNNKLTTLPVQLFDNLPVKIIRLDQNPWHCSCDMISWNPKVINRVKRYHIPAPNNTLCQKMYDKGSMCFETYEPKFEATYSYEKRVSPVCETPMKFKQLSVFQVLRKDLKYCHQIQKHNNNLQQIDKNDDAAGKSSAFPENFSINTLKELEQQLMAKPKKLKKNRTSQQLQQQYSYSYQGLPLESPDENPPNEILPIQENLQQILSEFLPPIPKSSILQPIQLFPFNDTSDSMNNGIIPITDVNLNFQENTFEQIVNHENETLPTSPTKVDKLAWVQSLPIRYKSKNKKKNKKHSSPVTNFQEGNNPNTNPIRTNTNTFPISKKSLKLARAQRRDSLKI